MFHSIFIPIQLVVLLFSTQVLAYQSADDNWTEQNQRVVEDFNAGDYDSALVRAMELLKYAQDNPDPDRYNISSSLNNLGMIHLKLGNYEEAEKAFKETLVF
jgi:tetratricopeptide (TPR) repeat protein